MTPDRGNTHDAGEPPAEYANYFEVGCNAFEFVIDFAQRHDDQPSGRRVRIITNPAFARELLRVLGASIADYERTFGPIDRTE
jgi:hypothetical protein